MKRKRSGNFKKNMLKTTLSCLMVNGVFFPYAHAQEHVVHNEADLINAVASANNGDIIKLGSAMQLDIMNTLVVANAVVVDGNGGTISINNQRIFQVAGNLDGVSNITLQNADTASSGGAVFVGGNLDNGIVNSNFINNNATGNAGAVYVFQNLNGGISGSTFVGNTANSDGGAVNIAGDLSGGVHDSSFTGNTTRVSGGALYVLRDLNGGVNNTVFTGNRATNSSGGGLYVGRHLSGGINGSEFVNNTSSNVGGAVFVLSTLDGGVNNSIFRNNTSGRGGALFLNNVQNGGIVNSTFTDNRANTLGGALFVQGNLNDGIIGSSFTGNIATTSGGAVYGQVGLAGGITNSSFIDNVATNVSGGAIFVDRDLIGGITGSTFTGNRANVNGGAISADSIDVIANSSFKNNSSNGSGGAISILSRNNATVLEIDTTGSGVHFSGNKANGSPNSIHFALNNDATLNVTGSGVLSMYDPLSAIGGNVLTVNKAGSSDWLLGGKNTMQGTTNWHINDGTLTLTRDSDGNAAWISNAAGGNFNLDTSAFLAVVPDTATGAKIDATNINLDGKVGVGSDYRYHNKLSLSDFSTTLLTLSNAYTGTGEIAATAGSFSLGQYDYVYDNLHWATPTELVFAVRGYRLNPERNGAYSANMSLRSSLANNTNKSILEHLPIPFNKVKALQEVKYFTDTGKQSSDNNLWANAYNNTVKNNPDGSYAGSSLKTPGLILGTDFQIAQRSYGRGNFVCLARLSARATSS